MVEQSDHPGKPAEARQSVTGASWPVGRLVLWPSIVLAVVAVGLAAWVRHRDDAGLTASASALSAAVSELSRNVQVLAGTLGQRDQPEIIPEIAKSLREANLTPNELRTMSDTVAKRMRELLDTEMGSDAREDLYKWIGSQGARQTEPPPSLLEKLLPLWKIAVDDAIKVAKLPVEKANTVRKLLMTAGGEAAKGFTNALGKKVAEDLYEYLRRIVFGSRDKGPAPGACGCPCATTCTAPNGQQEQAAANPARFTVHFNTGASGVATEHQREQVWRARNAYLFQVGARSGLVVRGYTDSTGTVRDNERLAAARAKAVVCELRRLGVPSEAVAGDASQLHVPVPVQGSVAIPGNRSAIIEFAADSAVIPMSSITCERSGVKRKS